MATIEIKKPIVDTIKGKVERKPSVVLVDYRGITVEEDSLLRKRLREGRYDYNVYKNAYLNFAFEGTIYDVLSPLLEGPVSVVFSYGDCTEMENILFEFSQTTALSVKGAVLDDVYYSSDAFNSKVIERKQRERNEHIHEIVIQGLRMPITRFEIVLKQILKQKQKQEHEREFDEWNDDYIKTHGESEFNKMVSSYYWVEHSDDITITGIKTPHAEMWIPAKINGKLVTRVHASATNRITNNYSVNHIEIPNSVTRIGSSAFFQLRALKSIKIPKSVEYIGDHAFSSYHIEKITVDEGNTTYTSRDGAGNECNAIIDIAEQSLLFGCINTVIPDGIDTIADLAFIDYEDISLHLRGLESVKIPKSIVYIDNEAFRSYSLKEIIVDEDNTIYTSRDDAGNECNAIINIATKTLLLGCANTIIPDNIVAIENYAFYNSEGLAVSIPKSVQSISPETFFFKNSASIIVDPENETYTSRDVTGKECNAIIDIARQELVVGCAQTIFPKNITMIGCSAFYGCNNLKKCILPSNIKIIDGYAFERCRNLEELTFSEGLEIIYNFAFQHCSRLTDFILPESLKHIGMYAFSGCHSLSTVTIPRNVDLVDSSAFKKCRNLSKATILSPKVTSPSDIFDLFVRIPRSNAETTLSYAKQPIISPADNDNVPTYMTADSKTDNAEDESKTQPRVNVSSPDILPIDIHEYMAKENKYRDIINNALIAERLGGYTDGETTAHDNEIEMEPIHNASSDSHKKPKRKYRKIGIFLLLAGIATIAILLLGTVYELSGGF